ncbi:DUF3102 domain-containing protein [Rhizobium sp. S-51]|uniref:DUF3102 domain-containing protein n=1 Tax=Rhizobium terricola TaxID=2728849 RepID=A0A7Y0AUH4_9HYPH|nr:DUF3102 domain-containing protein [Rhizobium terricola]
MKEIEVEGVGIMRHLNDWQSARLASLRGPNRSIAPMAFGLGMTLRQFRQLTPDQQKAAWDAHNRLTAPPAPERREEPASWLPRPRERVSEERQIMIGRKLLQVKAQLPHGHFGPWIDKESGITRKQAARFMKAAKQPRQSG